MLNDIRAASYMQPNRFCRTTHFSRPGLGNTFGSVRVQPFQGAIELQTDFNDSGDQPSHLEDQPLPRVQPKPNQKSATTVKAGRRVNDGLQGQKLFSHTISYLKSRKRAGEDQVLVGVRSRSSAYSATIQCN